MRIPFSQIFLSDHDQPLSPPLAQATASVALSFPDAQRTVYDKQSLRQFIVDHFDPEVVRAYDRLRPYAYKADLGRYCLLYEQGGWYSDISVRFLMSVSLGKDVSLLAFRDIQRNSGTTWSCSIAVLFAKPKLACFKTAIEYVLKNCRERYYGLTPLCPTGPTLFGQALAAGRARHDYVFGDSLYLTPDHEVTNRAYVLPNGEILAMAKRAEGGNLKQLGAKGTNNYNDFWRKRDVYAADAEAPPAAPAR